MVLPWAGLGPNGYDDGIIGVARVEEQERRRPRKLSKRGRARYGTHRTGFILAVLRRRGWLGGGDRLSMLGTKEEGVNHYRVALQRSGGARYYRPSSPAAMKHSGIAVGCSALLGFAIMRHREYHYWSLFRR